MSSLEKTAQTQLEDIQEKTGHSLEELADIIKRTGLTTHSEVRAMLQREYALSYSDATVLVHGVMKG